MFTPLPTLSNGLIQGLGAPARETRADLARLGQELATGQASDVAEALNHDFTALALVERDLAVIDSLQFSIDRGNRVALAAEGALGAIGTTLQDIRNQVVPMVEGAQTMNAPVLARSAEAAFDQIVDRLNVSQVDGAIFAAGRGDVSALASGPDIRTGLQAHIATGTSLQDRLALVEDFFAAGGPFETTYLTPDTGAAFSFRTDTDQIVEFSARAGDPEMRGALQAIGKVMAAAPALASGDPAAAEYIAIQAAADLATAGNGIVSATANVGRFQQQMEQASDALKAKSFSAQQARDSLIGIDPYETATKLQEETARLETIYTLTARLSGLRLTDYL